METNPCKMKPYQLPSLSASFKVILLMLSKLASTSLILVKHIKMDIFTWVHYSGKYLMYMCISVWEINGRQVAMATKKYLQATCFSPVGANLATSYTVYGLRTPVRYIRTYGVQRRCCIAVQRSGLARLICACADDSRACNNEPRAIRFLSKDEFAYPLYFFDCA